MLGPGRVDRLDSDCLGGADRMIRSYFIGRSLRRPAPATAAGPPGRSNPHPIRILSAACAQCPGGAGPGRSVASQSDSASVNSAGTRRAAPGAPGQRPPRPRSLPGASAVATESNQHRHRNRHDPKRPP
eukprot:519502-Hanusia_phi.AAC.1